MPKNSAYVAWYRTVQVCVQVPCTFVQVPCTFCACATVLRCTFLCKGCVLYMGMEEFVNFILCAYELHKNVQRRTLAHFCATRMHNCASFTCTHLVQATYAASDWDLFVVRDRPRAVNVSSLRNEKSHSVSRQASGP